MKEDLVGTVASIKEGKKQSNYFSLKNLKEVQITRDRGIAYGVGKRLLTVKILKGGCENTQMYRSYYQGDSIDIYEDVLDLVMAGSTYDIY